MGVAVVVGLVDVDVVVVAGSGVVVVIRIVVVDISSTSDAVVPGLVNLVVSGTIVEVVSKKVVVSKNVVVSVGSVDCVAVLLINSP